MFADEKDQMPQPQMQAEVLRDKTIIEEKLKKEQGRYETLLDMRMNNEIPREVFSRPCRRMGSFRKVI